MLALLFIVTALPTELRVCADPNNLPFSNAKEEGFENALATLLAKDLGVPLRYTWWPQRRGFLRLTLKAGACDVVMGVPEHYGPVLTTAPYYRSTYVFVTRASLQPPLRSLDDPRLHELRIGIHLIGDDYANPPPMHALNRRGIVDNIEGFSIYGDYGEDSPPSRLIRAVDSGEIDVAAAWGPLAGFFAKASTHPLSVVPIEPQDETPYAMSFAIALGVRKGDTELRDALDARLRAHREEIERLLREYGVPQQ